MKLNTAMFKKRKVYWVLGGLLVFAFFYFYFNRGSGSGSVTVSQGGPSDAAVQASTALAMAQMQGSAATTVASYGLQGHIAEIQASADVAKYTASLDAATASQYLTAQREIAGLDAEYSLETARVTADTIIGSKQIEATMFNNQLMTVQQLSKDQSATLITSALIGQIGSAKANDRDNLIALISAEQSGANVSYRDKTSGSFTIGSGSAPANGTFAFPIGTYH